MFGCHITEHDFFNIMPNEISFSADWFENTFILNINIDHECIFAAVDDQRPGHLKLKWYMQTENTFRK